LSSGKLLPGYRLQGSASLVISQFAKFIHIWFKAVQMVSIFCAKNFCFGRNPGSMLMIKISPGPNQSKRINRIYLNDGIIKFTALLCIKWQDKLLLLCIQINFV